jgi:hypothetical protein
MATMRVRFLKAHGKYKAGEVTQVGNADGKDYIDAGVAEVSKDMILVDYETKEVKTNGRSPRIRTNKRSRR